MYCFFVRLTTHLSRVAFCGCSFDSHSHGSSAALVNAVVFFFLLDLYLKTQTQAV